MWDHELLKKRGKLVVGNKVEVRQKIVEIFHDGAVGHSGMQTTAKRIGSLFYWKG